jgi:hypothetical protein
MSCFQMRGAKSVELYFESLSYSILVLDFGFGVLFRYPDLLW